jgi:hypothetical protein
LYVCRLQAAVCRLSVCIVLHSKEHLTLTAGKVSKNTKRHEAYELVSLNNEKELTNFEEFQQRVRKEKWMNGEL